MVKLTKKPVLRVFSVHNKKSVGNATLTFEFWVKGPNMSRKYAQTYLTWSLIWNIVSGGYGQGSQNR